MAIGTPTSIGSNSAAANGTTLSLTVTANVAVGDVIIVAAANTGASGHTCTFSDSAGNTWTTDVSSNTRASSNTFIGYCQVTNALTSGVSTITATFNTIEFARLLSAVKVTGLATSSAKDQTAVGNGTTTAWSTAASSATTQADELVIVACGSDSSGTETSTPGSGYSELFDFTNGNGTQLTMVYKIVAATGAQTGSGTWTNSGSRSWNAALATYKAAAGGGGDQTINPGAIAAGSQLFGPSLQPGSVTVSPSAVASGSTLYAPSLSTSVTVSPGAIASGAQVFAPALQPGSVTVSPAAIGSGAQVYQPSTGGDITVSPDAVASGSQVFAPSLSTTVTISPGAISAGSQLFAPSLQPGSVTVTPALLENGPSIYPPSITGGDQTVPTGFPWVPSLPRINNDDIGKAVQ